MSEPTPKNDLPEQGAIVQRDRQTYAVAPHLPGGLVEPAMLRRIADVAEKYGAQALKVTSAQRIAIVGLAEEDLPQVWEELEAEPGGVIGLCVRSVKFCPGTTFCKRGMQDSVALGKALDERYHGRQLPGKMKMGVSGCTNSCGESWIKDIGFVGTRGGWMVVVGGNAGAAPAIAQKLTAGLSTEEALDLTERIVAWYEAQGKKLRLGKVVAKAGMDSFREAVGLPPEGK